MTNSQLLAALILGRRAENLDALAWLDAGVPNVPVYGPARCPDCPEGGQCEDCEPCPD